MIILLYYSDHALRRCGLPTADPPYHNNQSIGGLIKKSQKTAFSAPSDCAKVVFRLLLAVVMKGHVLTL